METDKISDKISATPLYEISMTKKPFSFPVSCYLCMAFSGKVEKREGD